MVRAGHLTSTQLVEVEEHVYLGVRAARAYRRLKVAFKKRGKTLTPVNRYSGYRSAAVQDAMANASRTRPGSKARARFNLSSSSTISVAYHPNGKHEDARCIDFLLNGSSAYPNASDRKLFAKYGWKFQFGSADPNHVRHDNARGIVPVSIKWLKANHLFVPAAKR